MEGQLVAGLDAHVLATDLDVAVGGIDGDAGEGTDLHVTVGTHDLDLAVVRRQRQLVQSEAVAHVDTAGQILAVAPVQILAFECREVRLQGLQCRREALYEFPAVFRRIEADVLSVGRHKHHRGPLLQETLRELIDRLTRRQGVLRIDTAHDVGPFDVVAVVVHQHLVALVGREIHATALGSHRRGDAHPR